MDHRGFLSRFTGALIGEVIGDALGAPFIGYCPYITYSKFGQADSFFPHPQSSNLESGEYTSLSRAMLCFANLINENGGRLPSGTFLKERILKWSSRKPFSEEIQTAINKVKEGSPPGASKVMEMACIGVMVGALASARPVRDEKLFDACKCATQWISSDSEALICAFIAAKIVRECIRNYETMPGPKDLFENEKSLFSRTIQTVKFIETKVFEHLDDPIWARLEFARKKLFDGSNQITLNGYFGNKGIVSATVMAVFSFFRCPDDFSSLTMAAQVGGDASLSCALTGAFCGAYAGSGVFPEEIRNAAVGTGKVSILAESIANRIVPKLDSQ